MKILFVGNYDNLAQGIMDRLKKEENDLYFLTKNVDKLSRKVKSTYRCYEIGNGEGVHEVYQSIAPDVVLYEGCDYLHAQWSAEQSGCFAMLANNLEGAVHSKVGMFVFFSSLEVYGAPKQTADESTPTNPDTLKGLWMSQEEDMVTAYGKNHGLRAAILRLGNVFSGEILMENEDSFAGIKVAIESEKIIVNENLYPVHVNDIADAIVRLVAKEATGLFNVCGSAPVKKGVVAELIAESEELMKLPKIEEAPQLTNVSNHKLRKVIEWTERWNIEEMISQGKVKFVSVKKNSEEKKYTLFAGGKVGRGLGNILLLALFVALYMVTAEIPLFAGFPWMLIYVAVVALLYGVRYCMVAALFACVVSLLWEQGNNLDFANLQVDGKYILQVVQYLFFGIGIGYTVDMLREENRIEKQEAKNSREAYERLRAINEQNMLVKNEYEKRILNAKNSIPQLYSIIQKIDILETDRIFMEILHVIEEVLDTNTVAVYRANRRYLRLITALNEESLLEKRSIDLEKYAYLKKVMTNNELYEGNIWKNEPALVLPISIEDECQAVIIINKVPMENMSLYHINMLRTLLLLISRSLRSAFQYDEAVRADKYVRNTDILFPAEFSKALKLAKEKQERELGDFSILKIVPKDNMTDEYHKLENFFRSEDVWGMDWNKNVYVLLANTSEQEAQIALERLTKRNVDVSIVKEFDLGEK